MPSDTTLFVRLMGTPNAINQALRDLGVNPATVKRYKNWKFNQGTERVFLSYDSLTKKIEIGGKQD